MIFTLTRHPLSATWQCKQKLDQKSGRECQDTRVNFMEGPEEEDTLEEPVEEELTLELIDGGARVEIWL